MEEKPSLEERVQFLEKRVKYLEERLNVTMQPKNIASSFPVKPTEYTESKPIEWDVLIFQKILPRLFIFVLIIGLLWGFKAVSDFGLITNSIKIIIGFTVAMGLILIGMMQIKLHRKILGQVLVGGAIPTLMFTTFAMHQLYNMTGPTVTFVLNVIWIGLGLFFTYKYKSQGIGIVSTVGGVFVPFLIENTVSHIPSFILYETILYTLFLWISLRYRYKILYIVSAVFLHMSLLIFFLIVRIPVELKWLAVSPIVIQQFSILYGFLKTKNMLKYQAYILFSSLMLSSLWLSIVLTDQESSVIFAAFFIIYSCSFYFYKKDPLRAPIFVANIAASLLFFTEMLIPELSFEIIIGSSMIFMFLSQKYKSVFHFLLFLITYVISFFMMANYPISNWLSWEMLHWIIFIVATGYGIHHLPASSKKGKALTYSMGTPYLAILILVFTSMISSLIAGDASQNGERFIMSILWVAVAVFFMIVGHSAKIQQGKYVGVGILFVTLGKVILIDIHFLSVAIRAALFILLGVVGLVVSRIFYRK